MKKLKLTVFLSALLMLAPLTSNAQYLGVGTNVLGWAAATPNLGLDIGLTKHLGLVVDAGINPFDFGPKKANFWAVQPELRFYPRYRFAGHYIGLEGHYAAYHDFGLRNYAYRGNLYGGGLTYGYSWMLNKSWNLEGFLGIGYTYLNDSKVMLYSSVDYRDPVLPYWHSEVSDDYTRNQLSDQARMAINDGTKLVRNGIMIGDGLARHNIGLTRIGLKFTYFLF